MLLDTAVTFTVDTLLLFLILLVLIFGAFRGVR